MAFALRRGDVRAIDPAGGPRLVYAMADLAMSPTLFSLAPAPSTDISPRGSMLTRRSDAAQPEPAVDE